MPCFGTSAAVKSKTLLVLAFTKRRKGEKVPNRELAKRERTTKRVPRTRTLMSPAVRLLPRPISLGNKQSIHPDLPMTVTTILTMGCGWNNRDRGDRALHDTIRCNFRKLLANAQRTTYTTVGMVHCATAGTDDSCKCKSNCFAQLHKKRTPAQLVY